MSAPWLILIHWIQEQQQRGQPEERQQVIAPEESCNCFTAIFIDNTINGSTHQGRELQKAFSVNNASKDTAREDFIETAAGIKETRRALT